MKNTLDLKNDSFKKFEKDSNFDLSKCIGGDAPIYPPLDEKVKEDPGLDPSGNPR